MLDRRPVGRRQRDVVDRLRGLVLDRRQRAQERDDGGEVGRREDPAIDRERHRRPDQAAVGAEPLADRPRELGVAPAADRAGRRDVRRHRPCIIGSSIDELAAGSSLRHVADPSGPCGVWQLPQPIGPRTRYSPRSTGVSRDRRRRHGQPRRAGKRPRLVRPPRRPSESATKFPPRGPISAVGASRRSAAKIPRRLHLRQSAASRPCAAAERHAHAHPHLPRRLRRHVRPDDGRPRPPRRHRPLHRGRARPHHLRRGGQVRRRQGDPRRHGPVPGGRARGRRRHRHHQRADPRLDRHQQGRRRPARRPHRQRSARPATPTPSPASTSSSAPAPRSSPARARSSPPAASTPTSTSSARSRSTTRCIRASPRCSAAAPARRTARSPPPARPGPWHIAPDAAGGRRLADQHRHLAARATPAARRRWRRWSAPGACALKLHEDWGTTPAAIDCCLSVADAMDVQVMIHTDTLNESGFVEDTVARASRAAPSTPSTPRAPAAATRPTSSRSAACRTSSRRRTNPTRPYTVQHARRASRHAHGLPPPRPVDPRGRGLRREPHPPRDHRRRGHPARHRRLLDHLVGQPGDGPDRRGASSAPGRPRTR